MKKPLAILFVTTLGAYTALWAAKHSLLLAHREVCDMVQKHIFVQMKDEYQAWQARCLLPLSPSPIYTKTQFIDVVNTRLSALDISHLYLYDPRGNQELWQNTGFDNGIRVRRADDEERFFIYRIVGDTSQETDAANAASAASADRPMIGDEIVLLHGPDRERSYAPTSEEEISRFSGELSVLRNGKGMSLLVEARELREDKSPVLTVDGATGVLRLSSFLDVYFERESWLKTAQKLQPLSTVIIDLRGNLGGSFPAMLRVLSSFVCHAQLIGHLEVGGDVGGDVAEGVPQVLVDDLSVERQLEVLNSSSKVELRTFLEYPCFNGQVKVLFDGDTGSVAEIFAHAISSIGKAKSFGKPTAGRVVLAQWFKIRSLGMQDFSLSIPIANFRDQNGHVLEAHGVAPMVYSKYLARDLAIGKDSWLK